MLDEAEREGWSAHDLRRAVRRSRLLPITPAEPPPGKFRVLYADPPWRYNDKLVDDYVPAMPPFGHAPCHPELRHAGHL